MNIREIASKRNPATQFTRPLEPLGRILSNLLWTWHPDVAKAVVAIDPARIDAGESPTRILCEPDLRERLAQDRAYLDLLEPADAALQAYLSFTPSPPAGISPERPVAYYCAEYALHESFQQYCGGLGILAGDHLREASDMGLPLVGIGCFYRLGFMKQALEPEGRQQHVYPRFAPTDFALERVLTRPGGEPLTVHVDFPGRRVWVAVWKVNVGRTPLLLLDTDLPENRATDRFITAQLYMLGRRMRFYQECVLGIAGTRALAELGIQPAAYHMNEGHSALLLVERLCQLVRSGKSWKQAQELVREGSLLTIHTPVPAGNERFDAKLVAELLGPTLEQAEVRPSQVLRLGLDSLSDRKVFDMTAFALRLSRSANGVSILHGQTADNTWRPVTGKPVGAVTNGVHPATWMGPAIRAIVQERGWPMASASMPNLTRREGKRATWEGLNELDPDLLWKAHVEQKRALAAFAGDRLISQHAKHGWSPEELDEVGSIINPEAFLIGFARRFTGYKRPTLLWSDIRKLREMLGDPKRPVQLLFAGKAHPADGEGQQMVAEVYRLTQDKRWKGKVFFLEEYDMAVARHLVQGVDLWVNNPLRPLEASGTSGMKAALNGVPNASILDGWWDEGYEGDNGWQVGTREPQRNSRRQDRFDSESMYEVLLHQVLPLYWDRDDEGVPQGWVQVMARAMATSLWAFSTRRMLDDYVQDMYAPDRG